VKEHVMPNPRAGSAASPRRGYGPELFRFLREIAKHNDREWFAANKERYLEHVQSPSLEFVRTVGPKLGAVSRHLVADPRPVGGSVMRIYRDIRFSKDKSPYRTSVGIRFMSDSGGKGEDHSPGFFLHISPGDSWAYGGVWMMEGPSLEAVRHAIADRPADWKKVKASVPEIEGESLKRPPSGYDPAHPFIDDIKRKGFSAGLSFKDDEVVGPGFPDRFVKACLKLNPLNRFLATAIGVDY
jgi:uncharacterized protein (TIGR02453 family)